MLLVGDTRQHQAVEAGTPYQQLQEAGIQTARLDEIVRQKDPALKEVVEQLSRGNVREAIEKLDAQGRVHEIVDRDERLREIARSTRSSRKERSSSRPTINHAWKSTGSSTGKCKRRDRWTTASRDMRVLVARQEITGADRQWAEQYEAGDVVRYTKGSKTHGIEAGEYARVERVNEKENLVTVETRERRAGELRSAPPAWRDAVPRDGTRVCAGRPHAVHRAKSRAAHCEPRAGNHREDRRAAATCKCASTRAALSHSTSKKIRISTTAMQSPATAARDKPPTACWFTWTPNRREKNSSTAGWRMWRVAGTLRRTTLHERQNPFTEQLSRDVSHRSAIEPNRESAPAHGVAQSFSGGQGQEHTQTPGHSISR